MPTNQSIVTWIKEKIPQALVEHSEYRQELTLLIDKSHLLTVCQQLHDSESMSFKLLVDICGVDYSRYGYSEGGLPIQTFSGQQEPNEFVEDPSPDCGEPWQGPRFATVYHLLSVEHNSRLRLKVFLDDEVPIAPSVVDIWRVADWFEREVFDLYGIIFEGHPDLRRLLTDYGFIGHPFRKDFPLTGHVEMRYDPDKGRVVYEPVSTQPRTLTPRVIREEGVYE